MLFFSGIYETQGRCLEMWIKGEGRGRDDPTG